MIQEIKQAINKARKNRNQSEVAFLSTVYAEIQNIGKNDGNRPTTEQEAAKAVKKLYDTAQEIKGMAKDRPEALAKAEQEIAILERFMPKQLSEQELTVIIQSIADALPSKDKKAMGIIMKELKDKYSGQYDGKLASAIAKSVLS